MNKGFGERVFLTEPEWQTYLKRLPVRYIKKKHSNLCFICNELANSINPFQNCHRIGFNLGIIQLALTPDFLDSHSNIVTAHRKSCNKKCELNLIQSILYLKNLNIQNPPNFLNKEILKIWNG